MSSLTDNLVILKNGLKSSSDDPIEALINQMKAAEATADTLINTKIRRIWPDRTVLVLREHVLSTYQDKVQEREIFNDTV